ncbi:MAG: outer membrane protein transport protein [Desulfobulbaceae bacterium]|nr:outer membrane protein transport protein [Desulfobulbaceae bacterium]
MKRVLTCAGGLLLSFGFATAVYAGAIDNKTNWSAEYIRTLNRNAATDYADIAAYNPAGTVKLQDGFIINGSAQYLGKDYTNIINGTDYESDEGSVSPGIFGVYNRDKWAFFGAVTVVGGGGKVDFSKGDWTTFGLALQLLGNSTLACPPGTACTEFGSQKLTAESVYLGYTLGGAYEINDMFSVSVGIRYVDAHKEAKGSAMLWDAGYENSYTASVDYEQDGDGWGGIFGLNIAPNDKFNIGLRFETKTGLDFEATVNDGAPILVGLGIEHGKSNPRDLPALFGIGVSYWMTPKLRIETNYTQYLNEHADWGGDEDLVSDGYDVGIAIEYHFNDSLLGSIGYLRTETGINPENMLPENPELDANTIGGGVAYAFTEKFHTNFSLGYVFYEDDSFVQPTSPTTFIPVGYEKKIYFLALGLEYRF